MDVRPTQPSIKGPAETFTGDVWIDPIALGVEPSRVRVNAVHFSPGARTAWHSHAVGQTLFVTEGRGLVQSRATRSRRSARATSWSRRRRSGTGTVRRPTTS